MINMLTWYLFILSITVSLFATTDSPSLAVLRLQPNGIELSDAAALTDKLRGELFLTKNFVVVERERMNEILKEQGFAQTGCTSSQCAVEAGQLIGVERMVAGSISKVGSIFVIHLRIIDVESGEILRLVEQQLPGPVENLLVYGMSAAARRLTGAENGDGDVVARAGVEWREENGAWGLVDSSGAFFVAPQFRKVKEFSGGLAPVRVGKYWGYINLNGKMVIRPQFGDAMPFSDGRAAVKAGKRWGYIDILGNLVIAPQFFRAYPFVNGKATVETSQPFVRYEIDTDGKKVRVIHGDKE